MLLLVQLFALRASSHFEHDKGAPWLNEETLKRAPTPSLADLYMMLHPWALCCETTVFVFVRF